MILVLLANAGSYKLYKYSFHPLKLELLKLQENIDIHEQKGQFINIHENNNQIHHKSHASPHHFREITIDKFAYEIAEEVNILVKQAKVRNEEFDIIILAGPHMNGLVSKHLSKDSEERIIQNIQKEVLDLSDQELLDYLQAHKFEKVE